MTRETRIGLLVGLGFIILFGVVVSSFDEPPERARPAQRVATDDRFHRFPHLVLVEPPVRKQVTLVPASREELVDTEPAQSDPPGTPGAAETDVALAQVPGQSQSDALTQLCATTPEAVSEKVQATTQTKPRTYRVQPNDSLYTIAQKLYGDGRVYRRIYEANRNNVPDQDSLRVGQVLVIPQVSPTGSHYRELTLNELPKFFGSSPRTTRNPPRTYVVHPGDNLTRIARRFFKGPPPAAVRKIYEANKDKLSNPNMLPVGVTLSIPG